MRITHKYRISFFPLSICKDFCYYLEETTDYLDFIDRSNATERQRINYEYRNIRFSAKQKIVRFCEDKSKHSKMS